MAGRIEEHRLVVHCARSANVWWMMIRLRVRELAEQQGYNLGTFQRAANLPMTTARRIWHSSTEGRVNGEPLKHLDLELLEKLADFLSVDPGNLLERVREQ